MAATCIVKLVRTGKPEPHRQRGSPQRSSRAPSLPRLRVLGNTRVGVFIHEAVVELRKAHWPSRDQTLRLTGLVIAISILMAVVLGLSDVGFDHLFEVITL